VICSDCESCRFCEYICNDVQYVVVLSMMVVIGFYLLTVFLMRQMAFICSILFLISNKTGISSRTANLLSYDRYCQTDFPKFVDQACQTDFPDIEFFRGVDDEPPKNQSPTNVSPSNVSPLNQTQSSGEEQQAPFSETSYLSELIGTSTTTSNNQTTSDEIYEPEEESDEESLFR